MKFTVILICIHIIQLSRSENYHQHLTEKFHSDKVIKKDPCNDYDTLKYSAPIHAINIEEDPELDHTVHPPGVETSDEVQIDGIETLSSLHPPESHVSSDDEDIIEHPIDQVKEGGIHPSTPANLHASSADHALATPSPLSQSHPNPGPSKGGKNFSPSQPIDTTAGGSEHGGIFSPGHPIPYYPHPSVYGNGPGFHPYYIGGSSFGLPGYGKPFTSSQPASPVYPSPGLQAGGNSFDSSKGSGSTSGASGNQPIFPVYPSGYYFGGHAFHPFLSGGSFSGSSDYGKSFSSHQPSGNSFYSTKGGGSASGSFGNGISSSSSQPISPVYPSTGYYIGGHGFLPFESSGSAAGASYPPGPPIYPPPGFYAGGGSFHPTHVVQPTSGASGSGKPFSSGLPTPAIHPSASGNSNALYPPHTSGSSSGTSETGKTFSTPNPPAPAYSPSVPPADSKGTSYSVGASNSGKDNYPAYPQLAIYPHPGVIYKPVPPKAPSASPNQHKVQYDSYGHEIKFGGPFYPGSSSYAPSFHFFQQPSFTPGPRYPVPPKNGPGLNSSPYQPKDQAPYPGLSYPANPEYGFRTLPYPPIYGYPYPQQAPKNGPVSPSLTQPPKQTPIFRPPQSRPAPPSYNNGGQSNENGSGYHYFRPSIGFNYEHRTQYNNNAAQLPVGLDQGLGNSYGVQSQNTNTKVGEGFRRAFYPGPYYGPYYSSHYPPYLQHQPKTYVYYIFVDDVKPVVEYNDHHHPELPARLRLPEDQNDAGGRTQVKSKRKDLREPESTTAEITEIPPEQLKVRPHPKPLTPEQIKLIIELAHNKAMQHHVEDSERPPAVSTQFFTRIYPSPKNATHMEMKEETFDK